MSDRVQAPRSAVVPHLRAAGMVLAAAGAAGGLYEFQVVGNPAPGWWLLAAALLLGILAQAGLRYPAPEPLPPPVPASWPRRALGALVAVAGAVLWGLATTRIYHSWTAGFDFAWMGWTSAVILLGIGLDLAWGVWPRAARRRESSAILLAMAAVLAVAAVYRLGNIADFPGEAAVTQIEDLQVGNFGWAYLHGYRLRWEYLSSTWLAALGIWLGGTSQLAVRVPFAVVSALKVLPLFVWLRLSVGTAGALVGTALLAGSFWDVVLSRIPNNHNALIVSIVFALLAGPVRRGRPSAYALLGFFGGYVLHEYVAYRPLAAFAIAGAVLWSLRDRTAHWPTRLVRPLITLALLATMVTPLFFGRISNTFRLEYLDGWNRAHDAGGYYNESDTWQQWAQRRAARASAAATLFTVHGDSSPVRNLPTQPPLVDPVTCALLVLGIAGAVAHLGRPVHGLTLLGFFVTITGTLMLTGNFDVARVGGAVPYVYALAGFGAAGLWAAWGQAWGRPGRVLAALLLAAAVAGAADWSVPKLIELWTNPTIRRAYRNNLAYLTIWLHDHLHPGERVIGITPGYENLLDTHDGWWLGGGRLAGFVTNDVEAALRQWEHEPGPTLLMAAGDSGPALAQFLSGLLPGLQFQVDPDPLDMHADVAYAHQPAPPPELADRLAEWHCRGAHADFTVMGKGPDEVLLNMKAVAPFIAKSTWPASFLQTLARLTPASIRMTYTASFEVKTPGEYLFTLGTYNGSGTLSIDDRRCDVLGHTPVHLDAGLHTLVAFADFRPVSPDIALSWSGPDSANREELMPFYRLAPIDPSCASAADQPPSAIGGRRQRQYLTAWLGIGPFDNTNTGDGRHDFIDVPALSAAPRPTAEQGWRRIEPHDAFVDLRRFFAGSEVPDRTTPWMCGYAATAIRSPAARAAYLELAGSDAPLRVWLNGRELAAERLMVGYAPLHRPIALRAGQNSLVVQSCQSVGAWYFIAAITDAAGADVPGLDVTAALPSAAIPLPPPDPAPDVQVLEGFADVVRAPHSQPDYADYRGTSLSWWAYVEDQEPEVVWHSAPVPQRQRTIVALTASFSPESGEAELYVNDRAVIHFPVGGQAIGGTWEGNGYEATFLSKGVANGNSGVLVISVPPEAVTPGQPLDLRVRLTGGVPRTWFMVKARTDTAAYEQLSPAVVRSLLHSAWEWVPVNTASSSAHAD